MWWLPGRHLHSSSRRHAVNSQPTVNSANSMYCCVYRAHYVTSQDAMALKRDRSRLSHRNVKLQPILYKHGTVGGKVNSP
jgi:hypothetical protein